MKVKIYYIIFLFLLLVSCRQALGNGRPFNFNEGCRQAYQEIMKLKLHKGEQLLAQEKKAHPDNLMPYFLDNYVDFLNLFFHEGEKAYDQKSGNRSKRLDLMEQGDPSSPYYLFTRASIDLQWAVVKIKFGDRLSAIWEFRKAYLMLKGNDKKFPDFQPDKMLLGTMGSVLGTIPNGYKWISRILGMNGSVNQGIDELEQFLNSRDINAQIFHDQGVLFYCYLKFYLQNKPDEVMDFIKDQHLDIKNNLLFALMTVNLAINNQMGSYGLKVINGFNKSDENIPLPVMELEEGELRLEHLELDDAIVHLEKFVNSGDGPFYVKDALWKLSWAYYLKNNMSKAKYYRGLIQQRGDTQTDADALAEKQSKRDYWPNPVLLRARLYSDGGYFQEALGVLSKYKITDFGQLIDKIEYAYRLARIYDELGQDDRALALYQTVIKGGSGRPEYFAARAALECGYIYEQRNEKDKALDYYHQCLQMHEQEYKNSLDQRAKAGINRLTAR